MNNYDRKDVVRLRVEIRAGGRLLDPSLVTCRTIDPLGQESEISTTREGLGLYYADVDLNLGDPGTWRYRWEGTAPAQFGEEGEFAVRKTRFLVA